VCVQHSQKTEEEHIVNIAFFFQMEQKLSKRLCHRVYTHLANTFGEMCIDNSFMAVPNVKKGCVLLSFSKDFYKKVFQKRVSFTC